MLPQDRTPSHPGEILKELYVTPLGLTQSDLAALLQVTRVAINEIMNGRRGISPSMALKLADAFQTTPQLWMNLQMDYELWRAKKAHKPIRAIAS